MNAKTDVVEQTRTKLQGMVKALITSEDWTALGNKDGSFGVELGVKVDGVEYKTLFEFLPLKK